MDLEAIYGLIRNYVSFYARCCKLVYNVYWQKLKKHQERLSTSEKQ